MKPVIFLGTSLDDLRGLPNAARRDAGFQIHALQCGLQPTNWKPMTVVGPGVIEIRIRVQGEWRVICIARYEAAVYILHVFQKKRRKTSKHELDLARKRLALIGVHE